MVLHIAGGGSVVGQLELPPYKRFSPNREIGQTMA